MADFKNLFRREKCGDEPHARREPAYRGTISAKTLNDIFDGCSDFQSRDIRPGLSGDKTLFVCWLDGVASGGDISKDVLRPLTEILRAGVALSPQRLLDGAVYSSQATLRTTLDDIVGDITQGCCAVVFEDERCAVCFENRSAQIQRGISEPTLEKSLKGGKDSFTETLRTDTALVRKRIANPALKIKSTLLGRKSLTKAAILYVDGVADPAVVAELERRINNINVDGALSTGIIEEYVTDRPRSVFPQVLHTERPDRFSMYLMDGRVGILIDGLPIGLVLPVTLAEFMKVTGDASNNYLVATVLTVLRYFALFLSIFLPALYVAIAMYHQEMIPTPLLLSIIEAKQNVPFSTALEIMGMLISFELLQEAGLRLPNPIGDTVSIIGALIVGQSAVEAQVVSPIAIIVVAVSGIAGYTLPSQDFGSAIRLLRFVLVIASILAGFFGVGAALCLLTLHLADIDSFGVDYTAPLSDGEPSPLRRLLLQKPKPLNKFRAPHLKTPDKRRQK